MRVWSVVSQKGGSGKTTLALHLAVVAHELGQAVSVIDLDPQKSAEQWSELREARTNHDEPAIVHGTAQGLDGMLEAARKTRTNLTIIDTPPAVDRTMTYAAAAADIVLVPTRSSVLDQFALSETLDFLKRVGGALTKSVVILNAPSKDEDAKLAIMKIAQKFGVPVIPTHLEDKVELAKSLGAGLGVTEGKTKRSKPASAVRAIYKEISEIDAKLAKVRARVSA